ncbi:MAG: hypothetical protein H0X12_06075 [Nocardioides sp.]|nr:hypothetical protein [Nocardioides sp.]
MRKLLAAVATAAFLSFLMPAPAAQADHAWASYHWARTSNPFTLALGDNVDTSWDGYLDTSIGQWSTSTVLDLTKATGGTTGRQCRASLGRVEVCNAAYGQTGWLGLASISITGGTHITQGTVKVNDTYFALPQYNTPSERAHVMCQEIGHTLGLGHTSEDGTSQQTCMDYSQDPSSTAPNAHDYEQLAAMYAHLDSTTTVGATKGRGRQSAQVGNDPSTWGREVHSSTNGRHSTFVRDFGGGNVVVTEVTWAR